jgi:hypothetical protein
MRFTARLMGWWRTHWMPAAEYDRLNGLYCEARRDILHAETDRQEARNDRRVAQKALEDHLEASRLTRVSGTMFRAPHQFGRVLRLEIILSDEVFLLAKDPMMIQKLIADEVAWKSRRAVETLNFALARQVMEEPVDPRRTNE